ncbi:MAG: hypothetical protein MHPSP_003547, partial [Paramarteilia canceri]
MDAGFIPTVNKNLPMDKDSIVNCLDYDPNLRIGAIGTNIGIMIIFEIDENLNDLKRLQATEKFFAQSIDCLKIMPSSGIVLATNKSNYYSYDMETCLIINQNTSQSSSKSSYSCI